MDIEVGEYVRIKNGAIRKITRICEGKEKTIFGKYGLDKPYNNSHSVAKTKIVKHSHNIIDLIEVDDIVNGERVMCLGKETNNCDYDIGTEYSDDFGEYFGYNEEDIKTILTHEQYEANCYRLKD